MRPERLDILAMLLERKVLDMQSTTPSAGETPEERDLRVVRAAQEIVRRYAEKIEKMRRPRGGCRSCR